MMREAGNPDLLAGFRPATPVAADQQPRWNTDSTIAVAALVVSLTSRGPVVYRQARVGMGGRISSS